MSDISIAAAIKEVIFQITPSLTPRAPVTVIPTIGAITLTVSPSDSLKFVMDGMVTWHDGTAEEELGITSVNTTTGVITLDFGNVGYSGLQFNHANGAIIGSNLFDYLPNTIAPMLAGGLPVIFVFATNRTIGQKVYGRTEQLYVFQIQVRRSIIQRSDIAMHANVWTRRQQKSARSDMWNILQGLLQNQQLNTSTGPNAIGFGDGTSARRAIVRAQPVHVTDDSIQIALAADLMVRSSPTPFNASP